MKQQTHNRRKLPGNTSLVPSSRTESLNVKSVLQPRREKTSKDGCMSAKKHSVFVIGVNGNPLTSTTPSKARKLLEGNQAKKCWSKFGTFGIRMLVEVREETPDIALGVDTGTKFEGYSVVVGTENPINVKLDLPDKKVIVRKMEERKNLRRARRWRNCRRRPVRSNNRKRKDWLAPSQAVVVGSRLKIIKEFFKIYPINLVAFEGVKFNHAKYRWGKNFSTMEIGKTRIRNYFKSHGAKVYEYKGFETEKLRKQYSYRKTSIKNADKFTAHCSDSLSLAVDVTTGERIEPGPFLVVDDTYRLVRRKLHYTQPAKGNIRPFYAQGTVFGLRKGLLIGLKNNKVGQLCGEHKRDGYRYYDTNGRRESTHKILWISSNFFTRRDNTSA